MSGLEHQSLSDHRQKNRGPLFPVRVHQQHVSIFELLSTRLLLLNLKVVLGNIWVTVGREKPCTHMHRAASQKAVYTNEIRILEGTYGNRVKVADLGQNDLIT